MCFLEESYKWMQFLNFWERPLYEICEYAFNGWSSFAPKQILHEIKVVSLEQEKTFFSSTE